MLFHVSKEYPREACGFIGGNNNTVQNIVTAINTSSSNSRYEIDPREQLKIFRHLEESGLDLLAIYHSHPSGPSTPSSADISEWNYPQTFSVIWSNQHREWSCKAFIMLANDYKEIPILSD